MSGYARERTVARLCDQCISGHRPAIALCVGHVISGQSLRYSVPRFMSAISAGRIRDDDKPSLTQSVFLCDLCSKAMILDDHRVHREPQKSSGLVRVRLHEPGAARWLVRPC